jgi:hypothetical protein
MTWAHQFLDQGRFSWSTIAVSSLFEINSKIRVKKRGLLIL